MHFTIELCRHLKCSVQLRKCCTVLWLSHQLAVSFRARIMFITFITNAHHNFILLCRRAKIKTEKKILMLNLNGIRAIKTERNVKPRQNFSRDETSVCMCTCAYCACLCDRWWFVIICDMFWYPIFEHIDLMINDSNRCCHDVDSIYGDQFTFNILHNLFSNEA